MPEPKPNRKSKPVISPAALRRVPLVIPKRPSRAFMDELIRRSSKIASLGFGRGHWIKHAKTVNPEAYVHGIEAKYEFEDDSPRRKRARQKPIEVEGGYLSYKGFEHWLKQPEQYELVNAGLFLLNHREAMRSQLIDQVRSRIRLDKNSDYSRQFNEELDKKAQEAGKRRNLLYNSVLENHGIRIGSELADKKILEQLRILKDKKLKRDGVLRVVEWRAGLDKTIELLEKAGFSGIKWRMIPQEETISEFEKRAGFEEYHTIGSGHGAPYEIYAFK